MVYSISAFIARAKTFAPFQALSPCITIVPLAQGFEMILNDRHLREAIGAQIEFAQETTRLAELVQRQRALEQESDSIEEGYPRRLTEALVSFGLSLSLQHPIAYVEAEFFGGSGEQYGVLWDKEQITLLPSTNGVFSRYYSSEHRDGPINSVLRGLGAQIGKYDEFDALELGLERSVVGWFNRINPHAKTGDCKAKL